MASQRIRLPVVPKKYVDTHPDISVLDAKAGIKHETNGPDEGIDLLCGRCDALLAEGMDAGQLRNVVLTCDCGALNKT